MKTPTPGSVHEQLLELFPRISARGERCFLRVEVDPSPVAPAVRPTAWWHDGERGETYAGYGVVAEGRADGASRTHEIAEVLGDWRTRWVATAHVEPLPMAFGGLSFDPNHARTPRWAPWGDARFAIPAVLVWDDGHARRRFVTIEASPTDTLVTLHARIDAANAGLTEEPLAQVGSPADAPLVGDAQSATAYRDRVAAAVDHIGAGAVEKLVVTREACYAPPKGYHISMRHTFEALRDQNPTAYTFLLTGPSGSTFIGAPPETLARLDGGRLSTHALAGTAPRGATAEEDRLLGAALLADEKEVAEHDVVVRAIERALASLSPRQIVTAQKRILPLAHVQHIATPVSADLDAETGVVEAIDALHPTPAVGGAPRAEALAWLRQHEGYDRGWYCGPVGWVSAKGDGVFCVALRSALLTPDEAVGYVGAGIVRSSQPEREWRETEMKLQTVASAIRLEPVEVHG